MRYDVSKILLNPVKMSSELSGYNHIHLKCHTGLMKNAVISYVVNFHVFGLFKKKCIFTWKISQFQIRMTTSDQYYGSFA